MLVLLVPLCPSPVGVLGERSAALPCSPRPPSPHTLSGHPPGLVRLWLQLLLLLLRLQQLLLLRLLLLLLPRRLHQ